MSSKKMLKYRIDVLNHIAFVRYLLGSFTNSLELLRVEPLSPDTLDLRGIILGYVDQDFFKASGQTEIIRSSPQLISIWENTQSDYGPMNASSFAAAMQTRGRDHDASKFNASESALLSKYSGEPSPKFGSEEYENRRAELTPALTHHYENNSHHPEHFDNGVSGMTLPDVVEMFCDWRAAFERWEGGEFDSSVKDCIKRFEIDKPFGRVLSNTAVNIQWF